LLRLKQDIGSLTLVPMGGGVFEVTVNGEKIYSKKQTGQFPDPAAILKTVRAKLNSTAAKAR
jgi:selenoprotein W-related protein